MSDEAAASNAVELEIDLTGGTAPEAGSNASVVGGSSSAKAQEAASEEVDRGALDPEPESESLKKHDGSSGGGEKQSKPKTKDKRKLIPVYKIFRFADAWDILMIVVGAFMALAAGVALPAHMVLFGMVINNYVFYEQVVACGIDPNVIAAAINSSSCDSNVLLGMSDTLRTSGMNFCPNMSMMMGVGSGDANSSDFINCQAQSQIFDQIVIYFCDPADTLRKEIGLFSIYYVALATAVLIAIYIATVFLNLSAYRQTRRIRQRFFHSVLKQEISWFDLNDASQLSTRLADDVERIQSGIGDKVVLFLQSISTFISGFVISYAVNYKVALVVSAMLPLLVIIAGLVARVVAKFSLREQSAYAAAGAVAEEVLSSIRTVAAFGGEAKEAERYGEQLKGARNEGYKKGFFTSLIVGLMYFVIFTTFALGFWFGSTLVADCEASAGDIVTALFALLLGCINLGNGLPEIETFASALGAATVVYSIIDRPSEIDWSDESGDIPEELEGNIELSDVIFHYPARPNVKVLQGLDLKVQKGQTVALVGPSGCGKSTVVQLIQRFYNPDAGLITVDGRDIKSLNLRWLRQNIGIVSQEPVLFATSILENIRYGKADATMAEVEAAAKKANAHDFIMRFPEGYNTDVGDRGSQMSGGQKQRIAIARALVSNPKILLLDEATSALDTESEKVVQEALDKAREGRTSIVIAHRLSTIQNADVIASIENGRVVEMGSHLELMDNEGLYFELVTTQTIGEQQEDKEDEMASFRKAVKRSLSTYSRTLSSKSIEFGRQQSTVSQGSNYMYDAAVPGLTDHFSRFSTEDIPGLAHPSPYAGRITFPGPEEVNIDNQEDEEQEEEEEGGEKVVRFDDSAQVEGDIGLRGRKGSVLSKLIKKRKKADDLPKLSFLDLLKMNQPDWPFVVVGVACSGLIGALFPFMSILFSEALRVYGLQFRSEIEEGATRFALGYVGLAVGASLTYFTATFALSLAGERLTKRLRYKSFTAMLRQEIGWFDDKRNSTGALSTRLAADASEVKGATGIRLGTVLQTVFGLIVATVIAFTASWELALVLMFCFPVLGITGYFQVRLLRGRTEKNKKRMEKSGQTAYESVSNIRTVAGLGVEGRFTEEYDKTLKGPFKANIRSVFGQAVILALSQSIIFYLFSAGYSFGAFLVIEGRASYDDIFRVFAAVVFTALSLGRASSFASDATKAQNSAARILKLLRRQPLIDATSKEGMKLDSTTGVIEVNSAHFIYPSRPEVQVLQGLSVTVKPGQTLALVGPSGCGKSTVVSLIERFYDPSAGALKLEDVDLRDLNLRWLRSQIGIVSQEPVLFDCSIAENIRYGALFREVSDSEIVEAAKSANIHSFIESLPQGYSTNVGAKGTQLSGGQKQRIAIARALVRDPKVLLLDEATSALDTESEKVVQEALDKAREGRTSIVIAHRLSTIYNSDLIAVIHNGVVFEQGTHAELMAQKGAYYHLNTVQLDDVE